MSHDKAKELEELRRIKPHEGEAGHIVAVRGTVNLKFTFVLFGTERALRRVFNKLSGFNQRQKLMRALEVRLGPFFVLFLGNVAFLSPSPCFLLGRLRLATPQWNSKSN